MAQSLARSAQDATEVAAGLQIFLDHIPQHNTDIYECIQELIALGNAFSSLEIEFPEYHRLSSRIAEDVDLVLRSFYLTQLRVRGMFGETRYVKFTGERPYRRAWEDLSEELKRKERGPGLLSRLETYSVFMQDIISSLKGYSLDPQKNIGNTFSDSSRQRIEPGSIPANRTRITRLLERQEAFDDQSEELSFSPVGKTYAIRQFHHYYYHPQPFPQLGRPPLAHFPTFPFPGPSPQPGSPAWSDEWDKRFPPAPDPPHPWAPQSPTLSNSSQPTVSSSHTMSSHSSDSHISVNHWGTQVFDGRHGRTHFQTFGKPTRYYGRPDHTVLHHLAAENFIEICKLPFDGATIYARFYWRPSDHRARLLLTAADLYSQALHFCIPLTALKLVRNGSVLQLYRQNREINELELWASLSFTIYEELVLFYCTFTAMKSQDWKKSLQQLQDYFHQMNRGGEEEQFSGQVEDGSYLHALRLYVDSDCGGVRLEARALRGPMIKTPIWTAFITNYVGATNWIRRLDAKTVQLRALHPYVFCHGYSLPRSQSGHFQLRFSEKDDSKNFVEIVKNLRREVG
ncbi:hypothetical protein EJ06DRAFT_558151 [Trichodelitschia bisporula]|uniref:Uncharacterized protein n=1 Tax=Trichodelitschia bisporula TaxID=703511 RepID=A0A6G1HQZ9_9PEZI|nr:hypothetical protein EJ06DRAFT_558151 [Trichodelitschia bisporula]